METRAAGIYRLFKRINKQFGRIVAEELAGYGITVPQIMVLKQIYDQPKTIGQISKAVDLSYSTVSGIVDRLERQGLAERRRDREDRRVVWIYKTDRIDEIKKQVPVLREDYLANLLRELSDAELDAAIRALQLLADHLENHLKEKDGASQ